MPQCQGTTRAGRQCKNNAKYRGRCHYHRADDDSSVEDPQTPLLLRSSEPAASMVMGPRTPEDTNEAGNVSLSSPPQQQEQQQLQKLYDDIFGPPIESIIAGTPTPPSRGAAAADHQQQQKHAIAPNTAGPLPPVPVWGTKPVPTTTMSFEADSDASNSGGGTPARALDPSTPTVDAAAVAWGICETSNHIIAQLEDMWTVYLESTAAAAASANGFERCLDAQKRLVMQSVVGLAQLMAAVLVEEGCGWDEDEEGGDV